MDKIHAKGTKRNFPQVKKQDAGSVMPKHETQTETDTKTDPQDRKHGWKKS